MQLGNEFVRSETALRVGDLRRRRRKSARIIVGEEIDNQRLKS